ncbi:MAG: EamA family transporter [Acidimicrobiales bacterium]|nr:EamA family transporter [Acidimicrobiales bacterium]
MLAATILALTSAGLHAAWNLLVKTSDDRDLAAWGQFLCGGILVTPVLFIIGWPDPKVYPYLIASGIIHFVYVTALVQAYHHGDFSLAYPLARGGGALLAALGGVVLLGDVLGAWQWVAIAIVTGGLLSLIRPGTAAASIGWAVGTAITIASYTLVDSAGARLGSERMDAVQYGFALMPFAAVAISVGNIARRRLAAFRAVLPEMVRRYALAGSFLVVAYTLVLVAVRSAPVGYVTMLRESSVVMGALAGWLFLHERLGRSRVVSSLVIVTGLVLLIAFANRASEV